MNRVTKYQTALLLCALLLFSFTAAPRRIKIYLIGDSTMSVKSKNNYPETGWGMPFAAFFEESAQVDNRAPGNLNNMRV
ncbi:hypothetical protein [Pedobacter sp. GR22-6]|uniref:hypothetical protein n=1 Tax=Pedobacter sp. GR22-6 TaxID=3127957 RepID=UPI00307F0E1D